MNLKLSYRDKVIFIVVMVILVLVAGFFLLIKPKFGQVEVAKANLTAKQQEKTDIDTKIGTLQGIIDTLKETAKSIGEKQEIFLDEAHPYINEGYIKEVLADVGADVKSISTSYTTAGGISRYTIGKEHILAYDNKMSSDLYNELPQEVYDVYNGVPAPTYPSTIIGVTNVDLTFESDVRLDRAYDVMDRIAEDEKTIILNTINTSTEVEEGVNQRDVAINLTMYSIFPLNVDKVMEETAEVKPIEQTPEETSETTAAQ